MSEVLESSEEVFFKWLPEYNVHITDIDSQHQELANIINRLFVTVLSRDSGEAISGILEGLIRLTGTHFELEERLMQQANCTEIEAHRLEHQKLMLELEQLSRKYLTQNNPIYVEMMGLLKRRFREHFRKDIPYSGVPQQAGF